MADGTDAEQLKTSLTDLMRERRRLADNDDNNFSVLDTRQIANTMSGTTGGSKSLVGGGEDGILAVHDCGGRRVLRWYAVHDGLGLMVALIVASDADPDVARSQFEEQIDQLVWQD